MNRAERIEDTLAANLLLQHIEVINESSGHHVPPGSESHFKVVLVSSIFAPLGRVARHRQVNALLAPEFASGMHALSVHAYSPTEWVERHGNVPMSPPCLGQNKAGQNKAGRDNAS